MKTFSVKKDRDGFYVVVDPWGYTVKRPEDSGKNRSEQLPIVYRTEVAALAAAAKFQRGEEERLEAEANAQSQRDKARLQRMTDEGDQLRQTREDRNNLVRSTVKVQELSGEIVATEHELRTLEAEESSLEGKIDLNRINISTTKAKLVALQGALKSAKEKVK